jgi:hypothetical protein
MCCWLAGVALLAGLTFTDRLGNELVDPDNDGSNDESYGPNDDAPHPDDDDSQADNVHDINIVGVNDDDAPAADDGTPANDDEAQQADDDDDDNNTDEDNNKDNDNDDVNNNKNPNNDDDDKKPNNDDDEDDNGDDADNRNNNDHGNEANIMDQQYGEQSGKYNLRARSAPDYEWRSKHEMTNAMFHYDYSWKNHDEALKGTVTSTRVCLNTT